MKFKNEDENYIYEIIRKNIKKYRRQKGWTQEKSVDEINYSLSLKKYFVFKCDTCKKEARIPLRMK